jgi:hypothetical protein
MGGFLQLLNPEMDLLPITGKFSGTEVEAAGIKHSVERDGELTSQ